MSTLCISTDVGAVTITDSDGCIAQLVIQKGKTEKPTPLLKKCAEQIYEYLEGKREAFSVPVTIRGTAFDQKVLKKIQEIPYGRTLSYLALAKEIGAPNAYRAVANACGRNRLPIIIPCHRVVASDGVGGYNGGIAVKKLLLAHEQTACQFE